MTVEAKQQNAEEVVKVEDTPSTFEDSFNEASAVESSVETPVKPEEKPLVVKTVEPVVPVVPVVDEEKYQPLIDDLLIFETNKIDIYFIA